MALDGARGACLAYDVTSPTRPSCISCFDDLLRNNCTGAFEADPDPVQEKYCPDRVFRDDFTSQLNLCIQNAILAGFACNVTCSNGLELDFSRCLCITPASLSTATGDAYVDVGSENHGAPVVSVIWPAGGIEQTRTILAPTPTSTNTCTVGLTGANPLFMIVRNRGDTSLGGNIYPVPVVSSSPGSAVSLQNVGAPSALNGGGFTSIPAGANAFATFRLQTENHRHLAPTRTAPPFAGGSPDLLFVLTGIPQAEPSLAPTTTPSPAFIPASVEAITQRGAPMLLARTRDGNLIFAELRTAVFSGSTPAYNYAIRVLCLRAGDWCTSDEASAKTVKLISGTGTGDSFSSSTCEVPSTGLSSAGLRNLTALTVDSEGNIVFGSRSSMGSSSDGRLGVICRTTSGVCSGSVLDSTCSGTSPTGTADTIHLLVQNTAAAAGTIFSTSGDLADHTVRGIALNDAAPHNIYFTVSGNSYGRINAICRTVEGTPLGCPTGNAYERVLNIAASNRPTAITIDSAHHILYWSQTGTGTVHGYCRGASCSHFGPNSIPSNLPTAAATSLAGTNTPGYSGDGGAATSASLANPIQLLIGRHYDGHATTYTTDLHDHNLIIVEGASPTAGGSVTGNAIRILCGNNDAQNLDPGFCAGRAAGTIHRIAGSPNRVGNAMNAGFPLGTAFANLTAAAFDPYKNLIVASGSAYAGPTADGGGNRWIIDNALYTVLNNTTVGVSGARYTFEDSAGKKSHYCLRVTGKQSCSFRFDGTNLLDNCICSIEPGLPGGGRVFEGTVLGEACP